MEDPDDHLSMSQFTLSVAVDKVRPLIRHGSDAECEQLLAATAAFLRAALTRQNQEEARRRDAADRKRKLANMHLSEMLAFIAEASHHSSQPTAPPPTPASQPSKKRPRSVLRPSVVVSGAVLSPAKPHWSYSAFCGVECVTQAQDEPLCIIGVAKKVGRGSKPTEVLLDEEAIRSLDDNSSNRRERRAIKETKSVLVYRFTKEGYPAGVQSVLESTRWWGEETRNTEDDMSSDEKEEEQEGGDDAYEGSE